MDAAAAAYVALSADGTDALLMAADHALRRELSRRIRDELIGLGFVQALRIADGAHASPGDLIICTYETTAKTTPAGPGQAGVARRQARRSAQRVLLPVDPYQAPGPGRTCDHEAGRHQRPRPIPSRTPRCLPMRQVSHDPIHQARIQERRSRVEAAIEQQPTDTTVVQSRRSLCRIATGRLVLQGEDALPVAARDGLPDRAVRFQDRIGVQAQKLRLAGVCRQRFDRVAGDQVGPGDNGAAVLQAGEPVPEDGPCLVGQYPGFHVNAGPAEFHDTAFAT